MCSLPTTSLHVPPRFWSGFRLWPTCSGSLPAGRCWYGGHRRAPSSAWWGGICPAPPGAGIRAAALRRGGGPPPAPFGGVGGGFLGGAAGAEYGDSSPRGGERLAPGRRESERLDPPLFSPATKAETGHDLNVTFSTMAATLGEELAHRLREASFAIYGAGREHAAQRGIIIADTKFEFGIDGKGTLRLIDELLTPDSSPFWPSERYAPGRSQPSFDKQPLRDYLASLKAASQWNGEAPPPSLPAQVVDATSRRYLEAYRLLTGAELGQDL